MSSTRQRIFFSGIGGSGLSAIASFMADRGCQIVGSDRAFDRNPRHPLCKILKSKGVSIVPQDGSGIDHSFDLAVFSTAVEPDRPEVIRARALGIPLKTRPEYLAEIVEEYRTIAVAGTSGKSTTSGMLAFSMQRLGLKPNLIGGGPVKQFRTETNPGNSVTGNSDWLVIEACESDGTIINYQPLHTIILNLALDHHAVDETAEMFRILIENTKDRVILNNDDPNLRKLNTGDEVTFSIDGLSHYRATGIVYMPFHTEFSVKGIRFTLSLPGRHNLYNALSCIAFLSEIGIAPGEISRALSDFKGIERRFDVLLDEGKGLVIDDYAHNPHKISSLMETVKKIRKRVCYIFQPHGFTPTKMMRKEYIETFVGQLRDSDHLILLPVYYAGGTAHREISSEDLADGIRSRGRSAEVAERESVLARIGEWDSYVIFGARDETLSAFARDIAERLKRSRLQ